MCNKKETFVDLTTGYNRATQMESEWSEAKTTELIELYRSCPLLWDPSHDFYRQKNRRQDALREIGNILGFPREEIDRKLKNLIGQFSREMKKYRCNNISGASGDFKCQWFAFKQLQFLNGRTRCRRSPSEMQKLFDETYKIERHDEKDRSVSPDKETKQRSRTPQAHKRTDETEYEDAYSLVESVYDNKHQRDEYDLFGEQIACKLRKLSNEVTRSNVQHVLSTVMWEAEIGRYDNYHLIPSHSQADENTKASSTPKKTEK